VGRAIGKTEEQVAHELMAQLKDRGHPDAPPAVHPDGKGDYRAALVETWGRVADYAGVGRPPTLKRPQPEWQYLQVVKTRSGGRLIGVTIKVIYGDPESVRDIVGAHTAYVERTNLTSRQMNGRLVRKTLSYSKHMTRSGRHVLGRTGCTISRAHSRRSRSGGMKGSGDGDPKHPRWQLD
jgi:hypothetical protein